jgi:hypothetical protein
MIGDREKYRKMTNGVLISRECVHVHLFIFRDTCICKYLLHVYIYWDMRTYTYVCMRIYTYAHIICTYAHIIFMYG